MFDVINWTIKNVYTFAESEIVSTFFLLSAKDVVVEFL